MKHDNTYNELKCIVPKRWQQEKNKNSMKKNNLKEKSIVKLKAELNGLKIVAGTLVGVLIVLFAVNLYGFLSKDNNAAFIAGMGVALSLSAILPLQFSMMKKIKTELKLREITPRDS